MTNTKPVAGARVVSVKHWTDTLFAIRVERPPSLRFRAGEFIMLGLMVDGKPLLRAYSIASPTWDDGLDFYSIKVEAGPLTSRLQHVEPEDRILLGRKPTGTLVLDALRPGKRLYLLSTGTGIAPFASILREPETYDRFNEVILTHTCRHTDQLAYGKQLVEGLKDDPLVGDVACEKFTYYPTVTQAPFVKRGRITALIESRKLFADLDKAPFDPAEDRVMVCGSMPMIIDVKKLLEHAGLTEGSNSAPGDFVVEKAFVV